MGFAAAYPKAAVIIVLSWEENNEFVFVIFMKRSKGQLHKLILF